MRALVYNYVCLSFSFIAARNIYGAGKTGSVTALCIGCAALFFALLVAYAHGLLTIEDINTKITQHDTHNTENSN